ncbi:hypothetical protein FRZ61_31930 [Hypericibacter adhaerens]|jgi:hypothetical protein|uniref:NADH-ubiquinone oxidoreductase n=1 Tax=Hypericibacter adhaerens TaxID=2602016 RepID=A0A5J6N193_9PROT|nr:ETC complex I subunit [Hypericibacter adhaerens]QEX23257.1 hypothetical protein FRZ61_31930 [Hypericibacter adhaerens]
MLELVESAREDLTGPVSIPKTPLTASVFPDDAVAVIYRPSRSAMTSGKANTRHWKLRFERRTPPFIEPLMGWTSGDDPLTQVELTFPTREAAVGYAERQGLTFIVQGQDHAGHALRHSGTEEVYEEQARPVQQAPPHHRPITALRAPYGSCDRSGMPDLDRALINPAAVFRSPREVVEHPHLTAASKRELLARWAWDEYLLQLASDEAMPEGREPSRLDEIKCALLSLKERDTPLAFVRAASSGDRRAA